MPSSALAACKATPSQSAAPDLWHINPLLELCILSESFGLCCCACVIYTWWTSARQATSDLSFPLMCWNNTYDSPGLWGSLRSETWSAGEKPANRPLLCITRLQTAPPSLSPCLHLQAEAANRHGNRSRCRGASPVWWDVNCWPLPFKKKKRNGSNGYGFMSVCAAAASPLTQLGAPYATVCIFYDVGLAEVQQLTSLMGCKALQTHTVCWTYCTNPNLCVYIYLKLS